MIAISGELSTNSSKWTMIIHDFDKAAGHTAQAKKTTFAATTVNDRKKLKRMTLQGETPKVPEQVEIVGYGIATYRKKLSAFIDERFKKAGPIAVKVASAQWMYL